MSTASRPDPTTLPLVAGQRLDRVAFHERYLAMPPGIKAELIDGVVPMPSPVGVEHAEAHGSVIGWLFSYRGFTPGVQVLDNASAALDRSSEPQPDALLRILPPFGGRTRTDGIVVGAPELVVEVADSTRRVDLGMKLAAYERAGVVEYVVRLIGPDEVRWHILRAGKLVAIPPDADTLFRSTTFPGLWLEPAALLANDAFRLRAVIDQGVATPEHAAFVAQLAAQRSRVG